MKKYIIEYMSGKDMKSASVMSNRNITQLTEMIESNNAKMLIFELEDGKDNIIALRTKSINAIYQFGN